MAESKPCNCPICGEYFNSMSAMHRHKISIHGPSRNMPKPYGWVCPFCQEKLKTRRLLEQHRIEVHGKYIHLSKVDVMNTKRWICSFCHKECQSHRKLIKHYKECNEKKKYPVDSLGRTYTQTSKEKSGCTLSRMYRSGQLTIKPISAKTKERLHNARKEYLATHRVKYNWNGPLPKLSYAEQYFYDIINERCSDIHWENNLRISYYRLDFANLDTKTYFEVDGEQHYDSYGLYHDELRTNKLSELGWKLLTRIRWKYFLHLSNEAKNEYVNKLLAAFKSDKYCPIEVLNESKR